MPGFQTNPLTITVVSGNDSRIIPRNVMGYFTRTRSAKVDFELLELNSPLMFLQTFAKLACFV